MISLTRKTFALMLLAITFIVSACSTVGKVTPPPLNDDPRLVENYQIGVGDSLNVQVWKNPSLSISGVVRPDGKISVPLVGDVMAAGKYVEELAEDVTTELKSYVRTPKVTVIVQSPVSAFYLSKVRVIGAVAKPASLDFRQGMTVFDAVEAVGGVTDFANKKKAMLIRKVQGEEKRYPVLLNEIFEKGELRTNYPLQPLDIITIPEKVF